jgi:FtsH-binding integral membrane protein
MWFISFTQIAHAQVAETLINRLLDKVINPLVFLLFVVALIYFLWGVFMYLKDGDKSDARGKGGQHIMWGLIGLVIMMSVYGIIRLIVNTFNFQAPSNTVDLKSIGK